MLGSPEVQLSDELGVLLFEDISAKTCFLGLVAETINVGEVALFHGVLEFVIVAQGTGFRVRERTLRVAKRDRRRQLRGALELNRRRRSVEAGGRRDVERGHFCSNSGMRTLIVFFSNFYFSGSYFVFFFFLNLFN